MGFNQSTGIWIPPDKWAWRRKLVAEWGKGVPLEPKPWSDILDLAKYEAWAKKNPIDPRIKDLRYKVVYQGVKD